MKKSVVCILNILLIAVMLLFGGCTGNTGFVVPEQKIETFESAGTEKSEVASETAPTEEFNLKFRNNSLLEEHFKKHGGEFPYSTKEEYLAGANKMLNNPDKLHKNEAEDGDDVYYLQETNEFIIVSLDGYIRTYFKPTKGIDYFNRQ